MSINLYNCAVSTNLTEDILVINLSYNSINYERHITIEHLTSEMITLQKLNKIIIANSNSPQPNFNITVNIISGECIININFNSDYFDWSETLNLKEKSFFVSLEKDNTMQQQKITELETHITRLERKFEELEERYERRLRELESNSLIPELGNNIVFVPRNIDSLKFVVSQQHNQHQQIENYNQLIYNYKNIVNENITKYYDLNYCAPSPKYEQSPTIHYKLKKKGNLLPPTINDIIASNINFCQHIKLFNINKLFIDCQVRPSIQLFEEFIGFCFLQKDHIYEEIKTNHKPMLNELLKYTNYRKLLILYDKSFDDRFISEHCRMNNIVFEYYS